ncbi:MAG: ATPase, partial [Alphaproteobacteria bacterium]|nr:ATPase [Alphaproteobacteria bacterium]
QHLAQRTLLIWIEGSDAHTAELVRRFDAAPKPMSYQPGFLLDAWAAYLRAHDCTENDVDPDAFIRWTYARALAHRQPRYRAMADRWGLTIPASDIGAVRTAADFDALVARALQRVEMQA